MVLWVENRVICFPLTLYITIRIMSSLPIEGSVKIGYSLVFWLDLLLLMIDWFSESRILVSEFLVFAIKLFPIV